MLVLVLAACGASAVTPTPPSPAPAAAAPPKTAAPALEVPRLRLPRSFLPTGYTARLAIDPDREDFTGEIAITGEVATPTSVIWLHAHGLDIARATATRGAQQLALVASAHDDFLALVAPAPLAAGAWTVAIEYRGRYTAGSAAGVFRQAQDATNYVYTYMEPVFARRAFPCFDEPDNKVPWQLTLDVPTGDVAVSNTPEVSRRALDAHTTRFAFAATPPLPSYLLAFGVGPFEIVEGKATRGGAPVRVITTRGRAADARYAAEHTARLVGALEDYFGIPYPYAKLDWLTVPYMGGAMENAGLITCGERSLRIDPHHSSRTMERRWTMLALHELAHQWFGNLVTMAWWDDLWLNEGFASWLTDRLGHELEPTWQQDIATVSYKETPLGADLRPSARRVREPIETEGDVLNAFDTITYDKGEAILGMFERDIGPARFQQAIRAYLAAHANGNATATDFIAALSAVAERDLRPALDSFLDQRGAPAITATAVCAAGEPPRIALHQTTNVTAGAAAGPPQRWIVPVCVAYDRDGARAEACGMLDATDGTLALPPGACPRWVMTNARGSGYYRGRASAAQHAALFEHAWPQLTPAERLVAFFDLGAAVDAGEAPLAVALAALPKLLASEDRAATNAALQFVKRLALVVPEALQPNFALRVREIFGPAARKLGLTAQPGEPLAREARRADLAYAAGVLGDDPALEAQARALVSRWCTLPDVTRDLVLPLAARDPQIFRRLQAQLRGAAPAGCPALDGVQRRAVVRALAMVPDVALQREALALTLDPSIEILESQVALDVGFASANWRAGREFFVAHEAALLARIAPDPSSGSALWLVSSLGTTCDASERVATLAYVGRTLGSWPGADRARREMSDWVDQCIARRAALAASLQAWLGAPRRAR